MAQLAHGTLYSPQPLAMTQPLPSNSLSEQLRLQVLRSQELQRLNEQLRLSEERFRVMFAAAVTGIVAADLSLRLTQANAAFCRMVGYSEAELLGLNVLTLTHPDDRPASHALMQDLRAGRRDSFAIEKRFIAKAGDFVWSRVSVSVQRDDTGQPLSLVAVTEDITQQRQMAAALQESRTLARIGGRLGRLGGWAWPKWPTVLLSAGPSLPSGYWPLPVVRPLTPGQWMSTSF